MSESSATAPDIAVRPMRDDDLEQVVQTHLDSFPGFFLTFLGERFLELFYESILLQPDAIALVAEERGSVLGFVVGVTRQAAFYTRLLAERKWAFASAAASAALRRPAIVPRLFRAIHRPAQAASASAHASLMSIAVRPETQGRGIGSSLVTAFCCELLRRGADRVCLTTDRDNNESVNHFYRRLGFCLAQEYVTPEGRWMNEYVLGLARRAPLQDH